MVHSNQIEANISKLGIRISRWFRPEIRELQHILVENERILAFACGRYFGGFAALAATDQRLLLIDKKVMFLSVEDIRYDMISEIDFSAQLLSATVNIFTVNKQHRFTSIKHRHHLRKLTAYAQKRIMELRHPPQHLPQIDFPDDVSKAFGQERLRRQAAPRPNKSLSRMAGSAAMHGAHWINSNPYTKTALMIRNRDWSRL